MTSRERIHTALGGGKPDRVPIQVYGTMGHRPDVVHLTPNHEKLAAMARERCDLFYAWEQPESEYRHRFLSRHAEIRVETRPDGGGVERTLTVCTPRGDLTEVVYEDATNLAHTRFRKTLLEEPADLEKVLSIPYDPLEPVCDDYPVLEREVGDRGVVITAFPSALGVLGALYHPEPFTLLCVAEPARVTAFLEVMTERILDRLRFLLGKDIKPVFLFGGPEYAVPPLMGPRQFEQFVVPFDTRLIDVIREGGARVIMHSHGSVKKVLPMIREMRPDGLHPLEAPPMGDVTMAEARALAGPAICLVGNIQIGDLYRESREYIDRQVHTAITEGARNGAFMLNVTASQFSSDFPDKLLANYAQYIESGRRYG